MADIGTPCISAAASSIFTPGVPLVLEEFHETNPTISPFIMSVHVIGFATGALVFSPLSEIYGRCLVMHISNIAFFFSCILCAVSVNVPMLAIARILLGVAGSIPNALSGGFVADMIPLENRASSLALLATGTITVRNPCQAANKYLLINIRFQGTILGKLTQENYLYTLAQSSENLGSNFLHSI